ncbi:MAG: sensor histidine kinase [Anaerolineales bacterium]|nr:sensor histidine kinase [Anaerolineales bacterium]
MSLFDLSPSAIVLLLLILLSSLVVGGFFGYAAARRRGTGRNGERGRAGRGGAGGSNGSEADQLLAIYSLTTTLSASLNYERVLDTSLDLTQTALSEPGRPVENLVGAVLLFDGDEFTVGSARGFTRPDFNARLPGTTGLMGRTIHQGVPQVAGDISDDPELNRIWALRYCKSVYCFPLRTGIDVYGVLVFGHPEPGFFTTSRQEILEIIGRHATIAIQNAQLYQDLELEKERMMEIQEEARKKLARDLHDGPTQSVAAIAMRVNFTRRLMERNLEAAVDELEKIEGMARQTTKEIRHMLFTLRPLILESQGLIAALESMAEKVEETYNQRVTVDADPALANDLEMSRQAVIFYIAEEAVNNARKHAQAANIWIRLHPSEDEVALLVIEDDGVGFNVGRVDDSYELRGSLGMVNMKERAELINGILNIQSSEGQGTIIQVWIPLTEAAGDQIRYGV